MAKIAITSIPYWGHVNVTLSIGALLLEHGHEVTWFLARDMKNLVLPEGGKLVLTNRQEDIALTNVLELLDSGKSKSAMDGSKFVLEEVLLPLSSLMHDGLTRALDVFKPDVLIHDEQTYIGAICSTQLNIPFITTHVAPSGIFETTESTAISDWYFAEIEKFQVSFGLPAVPHVVRSEKLGLTFCPRDFSNPYELMNGQVFVGPCLDAPRRYAESFDYERLTTNGKKNLMVSIGTLLTVEASRFYQKVINDF
ncbi:MAG: UDP:flavonoid glycosyltransferase YjiC (YdhE family), partial [Flavobacteriales bacterium]